MSSPRHSPPPSAAAPKPKGILKNASMSSGTSGTQVGTAAGDSTTSMYSEGSALSTSPSAAAAGRGPGAGDTVGLSAATGEDANRLAWDESNLTLHEIQREQQAARMKIDEPKTPFVRSASFGSVEDEGGFDLDGNQDSGYFQGARPPSDGPSTSTGGTGSRRSSAAEELAANTKANAELGSSSAGSTAAAAPANATVSPAVGLDAVDIESKRSNANSRRGDSRSPSFTLPNSRRSSAAGERSREGVREEMRNRGGEDGTDPMEGVVGDEEEDDDDKDLDPESKAKQDAFARKRNAHYGNEAEAMKIAAALAHQDDDDDEEEEEDDENDQHMRVPPVPALPNGRGA